MKLEILKQKPLVVLLAISAILLLGGLGALLINFGRLPAQIILRFDVFHGVTLMGSRADAFIVWLGALLLGIANTVLAEELFYRNRLLTYIFIVGTLILSLLALIATATIVSVN
ncbi:MAG: hypothetical protein Q7R98_02475 [Candidatus Jorgensenbacteria bacterium]|nr:hypothetical protein [Candidatus Jorgensenbacteria bacterium]